MRALKKPLKKFQGIWETRMGNKKKNQKVGNRRNQKKKTLLLIHQRNGSTFPRKRISFFFLPRPARAKKKKNAINKFQISLSLSFERANFFQNIFRFKKISKNNISFLSSPSILFKNPNINLKLNFRNTRPSQNIN